MTCVFYLSAAGADERLDRWLTARCAAAGLKKLTRSQIQALCAAGAVRVNDRRVRAATVLRQGDSVKLTVPDDLLRRNEEEQLVAEPFRLSVLYEDEALLALDKPAGMVVHPAAGHLQGTVVHQLLARGPLSTLGGAERPGIVHRLDEGTSGVLVIAKTDEAHQDLIEQFKKRSIEKIYMALVHGVVSEDEGRIEGPIGRDRANRQRMRIISSGRPAITEFRVLKRFTEQTLLEVRPRTGRTHQIRVHLRAIGHPVVGDALYGKRKEQGTTRMMLHAWQLKLSHPITRESLHLMAPLPEEFARLDPELLADSPAVIKERDIREPNAQIEQKRGDLAPEEDAQNAQRDQRRRGFAEETRLDDDPAPAPETEHERSQEQGCVRR